MGTITLPNFRTTADVTMNTRLKDGGVAIDWAGLSNIKAWLYSDAQKAIAGRCDVSIDQTDSTKLVCEYSATKPQYLGVQRLIVQAKYMGRTKTYDKAVFNFVPRTADQEGTQIVIDDPEVDVEIEVEDISSSLIERLIAACIKVTEEAKKVVDVQRGPQGLSAYEVAVQNGFEGTEEEWLASLEGKSAYEIAVELGYEGTEEQWIASLKGVPGTTPHIGQNGNWFIGDVDTGVAAEGQNGVTPHIGGNGNWFIGDTDAGVLARGTNGVTPHIGNNGHWFIGDTDTNVVAEGQDGNPGITPHIGANNHWFIGETDTGILAEGTDGVTPAISIGTVTTVEPGTPAAASMTGTPEAPVLNLTIPKGAVGATPNFTIGTVTTGEPGTPVVVTITGTPAAPVLNITIPQGMQGNTGSSVDYPYELVNNLTTNDATKGLSAQQGKVLKDELSQLEAKVDEIVADDGDNTNNDFRIADRDGNAVAKFSEGHFQTKNFDSRRAVEQADDYSEADLNIADENGNVIAQFSDGHFQTKNFDSRVSKLIFGTVPNPSNSIISNGVNSLMLIAVKVHKEENKVPYSEGYLFLDVFDGFKFYYSAGTPYNPKYIFTWDSSKSLNNIDPTYYCAVIAPNGDVIFLRRADAFDDVTQRGANPIIYRHDLNYQAQEIRLSDSLSILPCAGVQNSSAFDYSFEDNSLFIAEYVRAGSPEVMNVWKVEYPYYEPSNWSTPLTVNRSNPGQETNLKHFHGIGQDTFSGVFYVWSGDDDDYSKIWQSEDNGDTWQLIKSGPEKHTRVLNILFLKDGIYWGTDGGKHGNHFIVKATRNLDGTMDVNSFQELFQFPDHGYNSHGEMIRCSTYASCYVKNPNGILFLDKYDVRSNKKLCLYFYSFDAEKAIQVAQLNSTDMDIEQVWGFRNDAVSVYPCDNEENSIICGFGVYPCNIDVLCNEWTECDTIPGVGVAVGKSYLTNRNKINNLVIKLF